MHQGLNVHLGDPTSNQVTTTSITVENTGNIEAGFDNSYGYYFKNEAGEPTSGQIIWANVKETVDETFTINDVDPNSVGFFIIPDGADLNDYTNGTAVTFAKDSNGIWQAFGPDGEQLVGDGSISQSGVQPAVFFSDQALNPDGQVHAIDSSLPGNQNWEDLLNQGNNSDEDYNDVNVNVTVETETTGEATLTVPLSIETNLDDDNRGTNDDLSFTIEDLPAGAVLSAGTDNGDGTWTLEYDDIDGLTITLPDDIVGRVDGKSSLGRLGLLVHATAGYIDPGWTGRLTLALCSARSTPPSPSFSSSDR